MGILIQGIEMPKDDETLCINIKANGNVYYNLDLNVNTIANAVYVPPYGRLIDANEFDVFHYDDNIVEQYGDNFDGGVEYVLNQIDIAPTIISTEKEEL